MDADGTAQSLELIANTIRRLHAVGFHNPIYDIDEIMYHSRFKSLKGSSMPRMRLLIILKVYVTPCLCPLCSALML